MIHQLDDLKDRLEWVHEMEQVRLKGEMHAAKSPRRKFEIIDESLDLTRVYKGFLEELEQLEPSKVIQPSPETVQRGLFNRN